MDQDTAVALPRPGGTVEDDPLLCVLREGARRMLMQAIEAEVAAFLTAHAELIDDHGRTRVVRNGHAPQRSIQTGIGYTRTYSPDPTWCRILEYYCPQCGTMMEAEYLPPGHPPLHDIELDIDALKAQWKGRKEVLEPTPAPDLALEKVRNQRALHAAHHHRHEP